MFDKIVTFAECVNLYNCPKDGVSVGGPIVTNNFQSTNSIFDFYDFVSHFNSPVMPA